MDDKMSNQELHNEEILSVQKGIAEKLEGSIVVPVQKFPKQMDAKIINDLTIKGPVEIKSDSLDTLGDEVVKAVESSAQAITEAVKDAKPTPVTEVTVKNIDSAKSENITVKNLGKLEDLTRNVIKAIQNSGAVVNVEKQEVKFPNSVRDYVSVRLTDGKEFYKAEGGGGFGVSMPSVETDPLVGYQPSDIDDGGSTKYYGFLKADGRWYIMRESSGAYRYAKGVPDPDNGGGLYTDAWTARASLSYDYYSVVF